MVVTPIIVCTTLGIFSTSLFYLDCNAHNIVTFLLSICCSVVYMIDVPSKYLQYNS